jgi:hypothetical protein
MTGHTNISGSSKNIDYWFKCDFKATWFWVLYCVEVQLFIQRNAKFFSTEHCVKSITMLYVFLMEECIVRILLPVDLCWFLEMEWIGPLYTLHDFLDKHMHFLKGIVCCRIGGALCWSNYFPSLFIDMNWCLLKVHILKLLLIFQNNATLFAKGCCIHWGMVFLMQSHFTSVVCKPNFPFIIWREHIAWIGACFDCTFPKITIAYVEGNPCRDVVCTFLKQCCTLCKGLLRLFVVLFLKLIFMFVLVKSIYLCMTRESYWGCTVVACVAEATMFGFGKNRVYYRFQFFPQ